MINSERLIIRPWQLSDADDFLKLSQDKGFNLYPITRYRQETVDEARDWIQKNRGKFAVIEKDSNLLIGMGGLTPWSYEGEDMVDVTYRLRESAWGHGHGWELAKALVDYAFNVQKLTEVTATITPDNLPSKRIAEKLGMKFDRRIELLGVPTDLFRLARPL